MYYFCVSQKHKIMIEKKLKGKDLSDSMRLYASALSHKLFNSPVKDLDLKQFESLVTRIKGDYWFKNNYSKHLTEEGFRCRLERSFEKEIKRRKLDRNQKTVLFGFGDVSKSQITVYEQKTADKQAQKSEPKTETKKVNMKNENQIPKKDIDLINHYNIENHPQGVAQVNQIYSAFKRAYRIKKHQNYCFLDWNSFITSQFGQFLLSKLNPKRFIMIKDSNFYLEIIAEDYERLEKEFNA